MLKEPRNQNHESKSIRFDTALVSTWSWSLIGGSGGGNLLKGISTHFRIFPINRSTSLLESAVESSRSAAASKRWTTAMRNYYIYSVNNSNHCSQTFAERFGQNSRISLPVVAKRLSSTMPCPQKVMSTKTALRPWLRSDLREGELREAPCSSVDRRGLCNSGPSASGGRPLFPPSLSCKISAP